MRRSAGKPKVLVTYVGYVAQTADGPVARVRARVLRRTVLPTAGPVRAWRTFMETVAWFASAEVPGVPVEVSSDRATVRVVSDKEGYVEARVPVDPPTERQVGVRMTAPGAPDTAAVAVTTTDTDRPLVVSDIDDTVLITGVKERLAMVRRTLFGDPTDRRTVPGMADLIRQLAAGEPVFYVSTSPWNLYHRLAATLAHHDLPAGPLLLSDWGVSRKQFIVGDALAYKVATISELLEDFPGRAAVLVGDSGQHDLDAYLRIAERHPGRIRAVLIREVPGLIPRDHGPARARAEELDVPLCIGTPEALTDTARGCGVVTDS